MADKNKSKQISKRVTYKYIKTYIYYVIYFCVFYTLSPRLCNHANNRLQGHIMATGGSAADIWIKKRATIIPKAAPDRI